MSWSFCSLRWWIVGIIFLAMSCTVLPPQKDPWQFFVLTPVSEPATPNSAQNSTHSQLSIGLGPVDFPGYLKRREIVTRVGGGQLQLSDNKRWAESLDANFERVL